MASSRGSSGDGGSGDTSRLSFSSVNGKHSSSNFSTPETSPVINSKTVPSKETKEIRDTFTKLDVSSKTLLYEAMQTLNVFRQRDVAEKEREEEETQIYTLMAQIKANLDEMKDISDDMNTIKQQKITSPRVVDQAKTYALSVENLKASLRQCQMDFQYAINSKQRQDLFTLSRSPFDDNSAKVRRRVGGAAEISSGATESMLHTRRILLETVQRSAGTIGQLAHSSTSIQTNQEELVEQNSLISLSKKLLGKYGRREWTDKVLICVGLIFFLAVVIYVVQKRLF